MSAYLAPSFLSFDIKLAMTDMDIQDPLGGKAECRYTELPAWFSAAI